MPMQRFDYIPPAALRSPRVPGLTIEQKRRDALASIEDMNRAIFKEERIINTFDREDLLILEARLENQPAGFKIGYRESPHTFYSAKGGVMPAFRRQGIAVALLAEMMRIAGSADYRMLAFDTFPNLHPGMTNLALKHGFQLTKADFNATYGEYRLRFEKSLSFEHPETMGGPSVT